MLLKKKLVTIAVTAALCVSAVVGVVSAANTTDTEWSFYHQNSTGYTGGRTKDDNTNVYVFPKLGQTLKYTVQVYGTNGYEDARSSAVDINIGTKATLRSDASADDDTRVKMINEHINYGYTSGVWSPDSLDYHTVY